MATESEAASPNAAAAPAQKKRALPLWLTIALAVVVIGAAGGGAFFLMHRKSAPAAHGKVAKRQSGPPHFLALKPFVVNFQSGQQVRYLQLVMQVMSHNPKTLKLIKQNDPIVRNNLLLLLGNQRASVLASEAGKQQLRAAVLGAIRKVVANAGGHASQVDAIYFTSFVMQ